MSTLFNKLAATTRPKVWTDANFEVIFNDSKCYDFWKALGREQTTWKAWSSFLERTKLGVDYTTTTSCWFKWVYWHKRNGFKLTTLHLTGAVEKQCEDFITFFTAKLAEEDRQRELERQKRRAEWRKEKRRIEARTDPDRVAFRYYIPDEEIPLIIDGKKTTKDCKWIIEETPFDTRKAQVDGEYIYGKDENGKKIVTDIVVECSNYGLTYTAEDMQAINDGTKKLEQCKPIVKEYPVPVITMIEEGKRKQIELLNSGPPACLVVPPPLYRRTGDPKRVLNLEPFDIASKFLKRPKGSGKSSGTSTTKTAPPMDT